MNWGGDVTPFTFPPITLKGAAEGAAMAATTYSTYYEYELRKLLQEEIDRLTVVITSEYDLVGDYSSYRYHIGQIKGLRRALELCDEADAVVNGKE